MIDAATSKQRKSFFAGDASSPAGVRLAIRGWKLLGAITPTNVLAFAGVSDAAVSVPPDDATRGYGVFVG